MLYCCLLCRCYRGCLYCRCSCVGVVCGVGVVVRGVVDVDCVVVCGVVAGGVVGSGVDVDVADVVVVDTGTGVNVTVIVVVTGVDVAIAVVYYVVAGDAGVALGVVVGTGIWVKPVAGVGIDDTTVVFFFVICGVAVSIGRSLCCSCVCCCRL